jgi:hypothetical protein
LDSSTISIFDDLCSGTKTSNTQLQRAVCQKVSCCSFAIWVRETLKTGTNLTCYSLFAKKVETLEQFHMTDMRQPMLLTPVIRLCRWMKPAFPADSPNVLITWPGSWQPVPVITLMKLASMWWVCEKVEACLEVNPRRP